MMFSLLNLVGALILFRNSLRILLGFFFCPEVLDFHAKLHEKTLSFQPIHPIKRFFFIIMPKELEKVKFQARIMACNTRKVTNIQAEKNG